MDLCCIGLNHRTAGVEVRERHAIARDGMVGLVQELVSEDAIGEAFVLSTCNRVEAYAVPAPGHAPSSTLDVLRRRVFQARGMDRSDMERFTYASSGREAVLHLFRVASSVDSMVLGEPQILGQLKEAWGLALEAGMGGGALQRMVDRAFRVAKQVRSETEIAAGAVSISFIAVQLARRIFSDLQKCSVLLLGAGEMAELTAVHLAEQGTPSVVIANRSLERAQGIATRHPGWEAAPLADLPALLEASDIVVSSTGSQDIILKAPIVREALARRHYRPLFLVDIAVPRDIDRDVGLLDGVYLYNIDDLEELANQNRESRSREAEAAEEMIQAAVDSFAGWQAAQLVTPTIAAFRARLAEIRDEELSRSKSALATMTPEQREAVERLTQGMINRFAHGPTLRLKDAAKRTDPAVDRLTRSVRDLFELADISLVEGGGASTSEEVADEGEAEDPAQGSGTEG